MVDTSHPAVERIESTVKIVLVQIIDNHDKKKRKKKTMKQK